MHVCMYIIKLKFLIIMDLWIFSHESMDSPHFWVNENPALTTELRPAPDY